jgi:signal transduction histidine kinase
MAVTMLAGCGGSGSGAPAGGSGGEIETYTFPLAEKAELSGLTSFPAGTESEPNNRTIFKRLEEQTNVHINWRTIQSDQWGEKIALEMSNVKTLPDFVFQAGFNDTDLLKYGKQGESIGFSLAQAGKYAVITVKNLCSDPPQGDTKLLFDRFYRGDSSRTRETGGSGIGLSIAKTITDAHKGKISCTVDGELVAFTVKLPMTAKGEQAHKA